MKNVSKRKKVMNTELKVIGKWELIKCGFPTTSHNMEITLL